MIYKIVELHDDGSGYLVITLDSGHSFGQQFQEMPMGSPAAFDAAMAEFVDRSVLAQTPAARVVVPAIMAKVGQPVTRSQPTTPANGPGR